MKDGEDHYSTCPLRSLEIYETLLLFLRPNHYLIIDISHDPTASSTACQCLTSAYAIFVSGCADMYTPVPTL